MTDTYMGKVVGLRRYTLPSTSFSYLMGGWHTAWYSPRQKARCRVLHNVTMWEDGRLVWLENKDGPPHSGGLCGINMFHPSKDWLDLLGRSSQPLMVLAIAEGWGKVIVHDDGYRVEQALVTHLYIRALDLRVRPLPSDFLPGFQKRGVQFTQNWTEFASWVEEKCNPPLTAVPEKEVT